MTEPRSHPRHFTFALTMPEPMMAEIIQWSDRQNLGEVPDKIALFLANVGNAANWHPVEDSVDV